MISLKGKTILVVDDEQGYREVLGDEFEMAGAAVLTAANGTEAFEMVQRNKIDAVVSDVRMPNGSGIELLEKIKAVNPKTPVVMLITGYSDLTPDIAYDKGTEAIFSKPCDLDVLVASVHRTLLNDDERLMRKTDQLPTDSVIELTFESLGQAIKAKVLNIGRGGMFVATQAMQNPMPEIGTMISFEIKASEKIAFQGSGICRWRRLNAAPGLPVGFGVEFVDLSQSSLQALSTHLDELKLKPFIPKAPDEK